MDKRSRWQVNEHKCIQAGCCTGRPKNKQTLTRDTFSAALYGPWGSLERQSAMYDVLCVHFLRCHCVYLSGQKEYGPRLLSPCLSTQESCMVCASALVSCGYLSIAAFPLYPTGKLGMYGRNKNAILWSLFWVLVIWSGLWLQDFFIWIY